MKNMLKTIETIKKNTEVLKQIEAQLDQIKSDQYTSYPYGISNSDNRDQIKYNNMMVALLEYWLEKANDSEVKLGKYIRMYPRVLQTRIELDFCLDSTLSSRLYDEVFGSHSTIYQWVDKYFPAVFGMVVGHYIDEDITQFNNLGTQTRFNGERHLCWNESEYDYAIEVGKKKIDGIIELSKNTELMNDLDEVLEVYFEKLFKNNKEEDWY